MHNPGRDHLGIPSAIISVWLGAFVGKRTYPTVMFCDLVDSTSIAAQPDAEEWRDLVNAYLDGASAEVMEMGGHVAKKLSDGWCRGQRCRPNQLSPTCVQFP
jgi:class 3 adenylate cyclase